MENKKTKGNRIAIIHRSITKAMTPPFLLGRGGSCWLDWEGESMEEGLVRV